MNQNWFKCAVHGSRYLLTVAVKSFGTDYLVMVLAPGIDNTGDTRVRGSQIRPAMVTEEPPHHPCLLRCMIGNLAAGAAVF